MGRNDKDFVSPRHRHNFEQFRFQLEGDLNFARDGVMTPGMVGYFPEGTSYGPQTSEATATTFVLQFGGPSGQGYLSRKEVKQGMDALRATGTFDGGVYRRNEGEPGKRNMDGFQAIWEQANGRPLQFPKPRYAKPVMMDQAGYEWVPRTDQPGVFEKLLGVFTERRVGGGPVPAERRRDADRHRDAASISPIGSGAGMSVDGQPLRAADHGVPGASANEATVHGRAGDRAAALRPARSARHGSRAAAGIYGGSGGVAAHDLSASCSGLMPGIHVLL